MSEPKPQLPPLITEPATVEACAADYAARDQTGQAATQHGTVYAAAQDGIPRTTGGH
ncbi:hypothetical protein JL475_24405 [Streptomyces sp. M2CJ-2]|uniref:hypothetical protein n=1 Tax=Streptomyces sp. M2CJ-2 TaxID=2803948 RepID=UPI001927FE81|nr:hypothetical protein [Streptomyces sp. M2CJ-2]MBL3669078.1 hypothetical protein [Streptomyces sp. M2CJ-2]